MPWNCATAPLACSTTIRLFSAAWSCSLSTSARRIGALLEQPDGGHVGQGLYDVDLARFQSAGVAVEQVQCADCGAA